MPGEGNALPSQIFEGERLVLSGGEYSNYSVYAVVRVLRTADMKALESDYLSSLPDPTGAGSQSGYSFIAWVQQQGVWEDVPSEEIGLRELWADAVGSDSALDPKRWPG